MSGEIPAKQLRAFGFIVGGVWALIGAWPVLVQGENLRLWAVVLSGVFMLPAFLAPNILRPLHRMWMGLGQGLGWVNTRILLSIIFYGLFTPAGFILRRKDLLRLRFEPGTETYRVSCSARPANHIRRQF